MNGANPPHDDFYQVPDESYLFRKIGKIDIMIGEFCDYIGLDRKKLMVNPEIVRDIVIRIDKRQLYFYIFHNRMQPNEYKELSLMIFWVLKLRPLWIIADDGFSKQQFQYSANVNEAFCVFLLQSILLGISSEKHISADLPDEYLKELMYSFRFRDLSKESLYLLLDQFYHCFAHK